MHLRRSAFAWLLGRSLGSTAKSALIDEEGVWAMQRQSDQSVHHAFATLLGPATCRQSFLHCQVSIPTTSGTLLLRGLPARRADDFVTLLNDRWHDCCAKAKAQHSAEVEKLSEAVGRLTTSKIYPSACLVEPFRRRVVAVLDSLPAVWPDGMVDQEFQRHLDMIVHFHTNHAEIREDAVRRFVSSELEVSRTLFDTIESNPLTPEQRQAVVTDEDATLVLAAAGSGKTSVIVAKVAHILQKNPKAAEEILLLAYAKKAANEMSARIREKCGISVRGRTFHSLGFDIIRQVEGRNPSLASWVGDDVKRKVAIRHILEQCVLKDIAISQHVMRWFLGEFLPTASLLDIQTQKDYREHLRKYELRTLKGEKVRSYEEVLVANWLHTNGIAYEYEAKYRGQMPRDSGGRSYNPDFYLPEIDIYLEHFGVGREQSADGSWTLHTAPFVDEDRYFREMKWKRELHAANGTTMIETYSYQKKEGTLLKSLHEQLSQYICPLPRSLDDMLKDLQNKHKVDQFSKMMDEFLSAFKASPLTLEQVRNTPVPESSREMVAAFLEIFEVVHQEYEDRLDGEIDYNDMIARAMSYVETNRYVSRFKHIIVDEFQDISDSRTMLLQALKDQVSDARIFAVGDDWQSIYRFAGSNINAMRNFGQNFGGDLGETQGICQTIDLGRTFRSVDKISEAARRFILENEAQIEKRVESHRATTDTVIWSAAHKAGQDDNALHQVLSHISATRQKGTSVLLLGKTHNLEPKNLRELAKEFEMLSLRYMTVHASKGLEADVVVILGVNEGSFPMVDRNALFMNLVLPAGDQYSHADERRLFYVALTRARHEVFLLHNESRPSPFVVEMRDDLAYGLGTFPIVVPPQKGDQIIEPPSFLVHDKPAPKRLQERRSRG